MTNSATRPRRCQGPCGQIKKPGEYASLGARLCRACQDERKTPAPVPLGNGTTAIVLTGKHAHGRVATVSDAKVPVVAAFRWRVQEYVNRAGVKCGPYAVTKRPTGSRGGEMIYMHILITGKKGIDHRDGNPLNNTDENLFEATQSQNLANQGKGRRLGKTTSDYLGVGFHKPAGKWRARLKTGYKDHHLGLYSSEETAAHVRDRAALSEWALDSRGKPIAQLNFPLAGTFASVADALSAYGEATA